MNSQQIKAFCVCLTINLTPNPSVRYSEFRHPACMVFSGFDPEFDPQIHSGILFWDCFGWFFLEKMKYDENWLHFLVT